MDSTLAAYLAVGASALANGLAIWNFLQSPSKKNADDIGALRKQVAEQIEGIVERVGAVEKQIDALDTVIKQLPDKDSFHELDLGLTKVRGSIETITVTINSAERSLQRIEGFLIDQAKGRN